LRRLGVDYVDLYLVHWPQAGAAWAWPGMERAHELGYARSIGVSNFDVRELDQVRAVAAIAPVVNQIQFNPSVYRRRLLAAGDERGVVLEAYSPLGTGRLLTDPTVKDVAARLAATPAQVLLSWCRQRDVPAVAKSTRRPRLAENAKSFDVELSPDDLVRLDALDRTKGTDEALSGKWWS
jgi:diketogulonate reductase-like aldo/keto reductase